jgi:hypothetical protein
MMEPASSETPDTRVNALRLEGADRLDPARFHYIEVLARRASSHEGSVRRILDGKLDAAVAALRQRLAHAQCKVQTTMVSPEVSTVQRESLADLVRHMAQNIPLASGTAMATAPLGAATPRAELKSVAYFRNTWSRLSAEKQVTQALGQAPKNAGPINSHGVALRSLALMRETSPDYLNRFMSYVDTLLSLEQGGRPATVAAKAPRSAKTRP